MARNYRSIAEPKTLNGNVTNITTQITLNNITGLPSPPYVLVLNPDTANEEAVLVTVDQDGVTAPTLKVQRAIETGSTAKAHTDKDVVRHMIVGSDLQLVHDHLDNTDTAHGATGAVVGTTNTQTLTNKTLTTPKINENVNLTATSTELNILDGATLTTTELNYVDGVTSAIQTQLNTKAPSADPTFTGTTVLPSTTSIGTVTSTEIGYLDGVTSAIQTQFTNNTPVGAVNMWVTGTAPTGWFLCQGQEVAVADYGTLAGVLGTTYGALTNGSGGAGTTHFRLPDLRGRVPMGAGQGRNVADSANLPSARTLGTKVSDAETHTLTHAEIPSVAAASHVHYHASPISLQSGAVQVLNVSDSNLDAYGGNYEVTGTTNIFSNSPGFTSSQTVEQWLVTSSAPNVTVGSGGAHNNTQPSTVINFIIKF
jgi:microcystin-dependent protein